MGLFSKFRRSKEKYASTAAMNNPEFITTPPSTDDLSSSTASPKASSASYATSTSKSTSSKVSPESHGSGSHSNWPASPRAGDYKARMAELEEDSKLRPHKKSWLKEKLDLADPTEPEYYERRFTASGNGSDYEQASRIATVAGGAGLLL
jgi:hypothetical protein